MQSIIKQSISIIISILLIIGGVSFLPIKNVNASGIGDYGVTDNSVTASYNLVSTPGGNYFEYDITVTNSSGSTIKDWIAVVNTKGTVDNLINLAEWNQLEYFKNDNILYVYSKESRAINPGNNVTKSKLCYTGSEVADITVYYSTTENAFDEFKDGGGSGGGEIVDGITDYGVDVDLNYAKLLQESLYFFDANMCGDDVSDISAFTWRENCHASDKTVTYNGKKVDLSGGYHDAGDHVKFGLPQAYAASTFGIIYYEYSDDFKELGQSEHALLHLKRFADYFKKCTVLNNNNQVEAFCYQVGNGDNDHSYWGRPEDQGSRAQEAYFTSAEYPCVDIVAETAAALAIYSEIDGSDPSYLNYAKALFEYAEAGGEKASGQAPGTNPFYNGDSCKDDLALASYWLYKATGDTTYKSKYDNYMNSSSDGWVNSWNSVWAAAMLATDNAKLPNLISNMSAKTAPSGFAVIDKDGDHAWGAARYNTSLQFIALAYDKHKSSDNYKNWAKGQMKYILGNNPNSKCFVVGYNNMTVKHPHHKAASGFGWDGFNSHADLKHILLGALIGGPDKDDSYNDNIDNYVSNEVAIDYQVGLVGAAVALYHAYKDDDVSKTLATKDELKALEIDKFYGVKGDDPVHEHTLTHVPANGSTCTEDGNIEYWYCDGCKKYFADEAASSEISKADTVISKKHNPGDATYVWTAEVEVSALGHNKTHIDAVNATCTENGNIEYWKCSRCNKIFGDIDCTTEITIDKTVVEALGHDTTFYERIAPSCENAGRMAYYYCSRCKKNFEDKDCTKELSANDLVIKATGHSWGEWEVVDPPTETEKGLEQRVCKNDPTHTETREIPVTTHVHDYIKVDAKEATCLEAGNKEYYTCSGCSYIFRKNGDDYTQSEIEDMITAPQGHFPIFVDRTEATCSETGNIDYFRCSRCNKFFEDNECFNEIEEASSIIPIDPEAHRYGAVSYKWSDDYSTVTAMRICLNNINHFETETVRTTFSVITGATEFNDGLGLYVSDEFKNKEFSIQTERVTIPAKGMPADDVVEEDQLSENGTAVGPGASEKTADKAITNSITDEGPVGSVFGLLHPKMKKITNNSITISWKKLPGAKYVIYGNQCGKTRKFVKITEVNTNKFTQKKLKKGTYYKYLIVAVKDGKVVSTSKTLHIATKGGKLTNHSKVKLNNKKLTLKKGKSFNLKAKLVKQNKKLKIKNHRKVKYESSNESVITVNDKGKIKAVGKGTAYVYAYAQDGVMAKIKVKVK